MIYFKLLTLETRRSDNLHKIDGHATKNTNQWNHLRGNP